MAKIVRPSYRAHREHPFNVWKALMRLRVMDKLQGKPEQFYGMDQIANVLYSNWSELTEHDQDVVRLSKLRFTMGFLTSRHYITEHVEKIKLRKYTTYDLDQYDYRPMGVWKARDSIFSKTTQTREEDDQVTREVMDHFWGLWTNRRGLSYG